MADTNLNLVFLEDDKEDSEFTIERSRTGSSVTYYDEPEFQFLSSSEGDDEDVRPIILCSDSSEEEQHLDVEQHSDQEQYYYPSLYCPIKTHYVIIITQHSSSPKGVNKIQDL